MRLTTIAAILLMLGTAVSRAEEADTAVIRPVTSIFSADIGGSHLLDTYLSPLHNSGMHVGMAWEHFQATGFSPENWVRQLELSVAYERNNSPAGNHHFHSLIGQGRWSLMRRWRGVGTPELQLMAGGMTALRGGIIYAPQNSNNVVSARVQWNVGLSGMAVYNCRIGRLPVTLSYQASIPVAGAFYSPEYGESYYEMYVGNHSGLVHFGWWGNRFDMENLVAADLHLGTTVLRLGYRNRFSTSWVSNLSTRERYHAVVIGLGGDILSLGYRKALPSNAKIVSPLY